MIQLKRVLGAWLLASVLLPAMAAHTATYYVATTGNNSNPGTSSKPWRTVAYAVSTMVAGDTTYVMDGTYNEGVIRFKRSGTQTAPIKLLNYPGHAPKIVFNDPDAIHRILIEHSSGHNFPMGWITIEGLELTNGHDGIKWHNLHDSTIQQNWIHHNKFMGILGIGGARIRIDRNRINQNGWFAGCEGSSPKVCNLHHGIYAHGTYYTITNNLIYGNLSFGITHNGSSTSAYTPTVHAGPEFATAENWIIANNTFAYNAYRGGLVVWGSRCNNSRIENNIFYENSVNVPSAPQGIEFVSSSSVTGVKIRNNIAYATSPGSTVFITPGMTKWVHYTESGNSVNVSDPRFVHAPATLPDWPNFSLTAGSPAIDKGLDITTIRADFDGTPRPQGRAPDIGAYEYVAGTDVQSPSAARAARQIR